jgi:two-component system cell cycle sensor histidine kinase/response regulator CckA
MKSDYYRAIALVDDDEDIVNLFTDLLRENGYDIYGFTNPLLLLDYIHHHDNLFRLVLIDYKMPQMTGCELANKIADINSRIEMVLITAVNDIIKNNLNLELIRKPLRMYQLLDIVAKYMRNQSLRVH